MTDWIRADYNLLGRVKLFAIPRTFYLKLGVQNTGELMVSPGKMEEFIKYFRGNGLPADATLIRLSLPHAMDGVHAYVLSSEYPLVDPNVPIPQEPFLEPVVQGVEPGKG